MATHFFNLTQKDIYVSEKDESILSELNPLKDYLIVRVIDSEPVSEGGIVLTRGSIEKSTLAVVLLPNQVSYDRDGKPKPPVLKRGDIVRLQRGNLGTDMPEAPDGQRWLAVPEDCIYYYRRVQL